MPITQPRMLSLLGAARDYQNSMERFFAVAQETRARVEQGQITVQEGFDLLAISIRPELMLEFPYESPAVIRQELQHFKRESRRNENKARKLRENRAAARLGLPKPQRGDGREHGWKGGKAGGRAQFGLTTEPQAARTANTQPGGTASAPLHGPSAARAGNRARAWAGQP